MMKSPERRKRRKKNNHHRQKPNIKSLQQNENNNQNPHSRREIPLLRQKKWENKENKEIRHNNHCENNDIQVKDEFETQNNKDGNWRKSDHFNQPNQNTFNDWNQRKTNQNQQRSDSFLWRGQFHKHRTKTFRFKHL